jgi:hypothetical protein
MVRTEKNPVSLSLTKSPQAQRYQKGRRGKYAQRKIEIEAEISAGFEAFMTRYEGMTVAPAELQTALRSESAFTEYMIAWMRNASDPSNPSQMFRGPMKLWFHGPKADTYTQTIRTVIKDEMSQPDSPYRILRNQFGMGTLQERWVRIAGIF